MSSLNSQHELDSLCMHFSLAAGSRSHWAAIGYFLYVIRRQSKLLRSELTINK